MSIPLMSIPVMPVVAADAVGLTPTSSMKSIATLISSCRAGPASARKPPAWAAATVRAAKPSSRYGDDE
jgi:hypothetical protein